MSIRRIKAVDRFYVVAMGFAAADFIDSGERDENGMIRSDTNWPAGYVIAWFESKDQQRNHPAFRAQREIDRVFSGRVFIDGESGLSIPKMHAAKAQEAREVKFNGLTDLAKLPFIAEELLLQPEKSIAEIADEIWAEHIIDAPPEAARTAAKRSL